MDIFDTYATDPSLELEGVWHTIGPATRKTEDGEDDPESAPQILVARMGNKRHGRLVQQQYEANKTLLDTKGDEADARGEEITIDTMAKGVLLGWKNLSFKGRKLDDAWNIKDAKALLGVKDFRDDVTKRSNDAAKYHAKQEETSAKK